MDSDLLRRSVVAFVRNIVRSIVRRSGSRYSRFRLFVFDGLNEYRYKRNEYTEEEKYERLLNEFSIFIVRRNARIGRN